MTWLLAQIEQLGPLVDKAATASDRWLFLFCIAFIVTGAVYLLVHQEKQRKEERAEAAEAAKRLHEELRVERLENRSSRKEDQSLFLSSLATLTGTVQEMKTVLLDHDRHMREKHAVETEVIARQAGEAAIAKYIRDGGK